ncbi:MAG TPA: LacI family DNA-binding transcriptional regulator [Chloroflexota bacterium]|nr:LacI family DNA-binding transcriptional regulator [Chloroflexota bacterium]
MNDTDDAQVEVRDGRRLSIRDVARLAGVSRGTVSRVLNDHPDVSPTSRERVKSVIAQVGYRPNPVGRALSKRSIEAIGILIPDMAHALFMLMAEGIESVASRHGYAVMIGNSYRQAAKELMFGDLMSQFAVSGVLMIGAGKQSDREFSQRVCSIPTVVVGRKAAGGIFPSVTIDHCVGAKLAVEHLLKLGHRRIASVLGDPQSEAGSERQRGYQEALRNWGMTPDPALTAGGDFEPADGMAATRHFLDLSEPPTAIFYPTDELAVGGIRIIKDRGLRVPEDVSVVSFNDTLFAEMADPPLTSVHTPAREMGVMAMQLLIDLIERRGPVRDVVLGVDLVIRRSTAPPPEKNEARANSR